MTAKSLPLLRVDFNEMIELPDLVLLSVTDSKSSIGGEMVQLYEGLKVSVCMEDCDAHGKRDDLFAEGVVEKNVTSGWGSHVKWCCRIDANGIRPESEIPR